MDKKRLILLVTAIVAILALIVGGILFLIRPQQQGGAEEVVESLVEQLTLRQRNAALSAPTMRSVDIDTQIASILTGIVDISEPSAQRALRERLPQIQGVLDAWRAEGVELSDVQKLEAYTAAVLTIEQALATNDIGMAKQALAVLFAPRNQLLQQYR